MALNTINQPKPNHNYTIRIIIYCHIFSPAHVLLTILYFKTHGILFTHVLIWVIYYFPHTIRKENIEQNNREYTMLSIQEEQWPFDGWKDI